MYILLGTLFTHTSPDDFLLWFFLNVLLSWNKTPKTQFDVQTHENIIYSPPNLTNYNWYAVDSLLPILPHMTQTKTKPCGTWVTVSIFSSDVKRFCMYISRPITTSHRRTHICWVGLLCQLEQREDLWAHLKQAKWASTTCHILSSTLNLVTCPAIFAWQSFVMKFLWQK